MHKDILLSKNKKLNQTVKNIRSFTRLKLMLLPLLLSVTSSLHSQTIYYVDAARADNSGAGTSWATAKKDLQNAIILATSGSQIWVKAGSYLPTHDPFANPSPANNRDKTFSMKQGIKVYGGFAGTETLLTQRNWQTNITTLSGDLGVLNNAADNAYHVVLAVNVGGADLDGLSITKGYAVSPQSSITVGGRLVERHNGGGIYNTNSAANFYNCTVRGNSADCSDGNDDAIGAGVYNSNCSSIFNNCLIDGNSFLAGGSSFGVFGAGMYIFSVSGVCTITNSAFVNNDGNSGFFDGSKGGALYISTGGHIITNSTFYNNTAQNGAALGFGGTAGTASTFTNCNFVNNTSSFAGTAYSGFSKSNFRNCIFWNNTPTVNPVTGRNEILSQETNVANQPTFTNCIVRDASGNPLSVLNTIMNNTLNGNPLFVNLADGDGADNVWGTSDDGLRLQCGSPAINTGTGSIPALDIIGIARTTPLDIGAYEGNHTNAAYNAIPFAFSSVTITQNASGTSNYGNCSSQLVAIQSGGSYTLAGQTTASVWIEPTQPATPGGMFVKRHYEINPINNTAGATAKVTLYFTQQEFNDFNAVSAVDLPTGPADASGKANLLIEKRPGVSSDGTGLPPTYTGTPTNINPADADIIWNGTASRWEVSFDVTGFSGFFVKTSSSVLPVQWLRVSGYSNMQQLPVISWQVNENTVARYEIETSTDGVSFIKTTTVNSKSNGTNDYTYTQPTPLYKTTFYRVKQIDMDGQYSYSAVIKLQPPENRMASVFPNPVDNIALLSVDRSLLNSKASLVDMQGKILQTVLINNTTVNIAMQGYAKALYFVKLKNGATIKIIKQ